MKLVLRGVITSLVILGIFVWLPESISEAPVEPAQVAAVSDSFETFKPTSLFFVGDIMLGRAVESLMEEFGSDYPFLHIGRLVSFPDIAIANFEGVIAKDHVRTPPMGFRFSMKNEYLTKLKTIGFDVLSLANNHSLDHGPEDLERTKDICDALRILCGGHPNKIVDDTYVRKEINNEKIGFIFLSTVWNPIDEIDLEVMLSRAREESTFLVAYVHWGEEYELIHNAGQEKLAQFLIDHGVDVVIGHHPHVVQDVAFYREKPIFYSLGNFIFDQYFSDEVKEGLGLNLTLTETHARYKFVAFRNDIARSQPHTASESESERLFSRILASVTDLENVDVSEGVIRAAR